MSATEHTPEAPATDAAGTTDAAARPAPERLGPAALKALAHPLRLQILDLLAQHGTLTASGLAGLVGESSGATSYHLRQLARHGLVQEVEGRGTARERWWERRPGGFTVDVAEGREDEGTRLATDLVNREVELARQQKIMAFLTYHGDIAPGWERAGILATANLWATAEQLERVTEAWDRFSAEHLTPLKAQRDTPGARPVQVHFNAFPLVDGKENPS